MPATLVQSNTGAQNTGLATVSATWTTAATAGNLLLLIVAADDYAATPPTGWTQSTGCKQETFLGHYVWWKVAAGGETSVSYTIGSATTSCWITAEYSGLSASPYDISNGQFAQSSGTSYTTPTITPTAGDRLIIASIGASLNSAFSGVDTWLNSFVERQDIFTTLASGTRDEAGMAELSVTANGTTGYSSGATYSGGVTAQARTGIIIAFKVAAGGGSSFTATQNDDDGLTDAAATASAFARTPTDPAGLTDVAATALVFARTQDDPVGLTDTVSVQGSGVFTRQVDDPAGLTDTATPASVFPRTVDDQTGLTDTGDPMSVDTGETIQDTAAVTDSTSVVFTTPTTRQVDDLIGLSEAVLQVTVSARQVNDPAGLADLVAATSAYARDVADVLGLTDSTTVALVPVVGPVTPGSLTPSTAAGRVGSATTSAHLVSTTSGGAA